MLVARNWILHNKKNFKNSWLVVGGNKKIVRDPYVFAGPMPSALPIPLLALWLFLCAAGHWVIWVIWVTVLNRKLELAWPPAIGSFGSCVFRCDPSFGSFGSCVFI
jgi:hypothetical protein